MFISFRKVKKGMLFVSFFVFLFSFISYADWEKTDQGYRYRNNANNQYVVNNWLQTGNGYYYMDQYGLAVKGWYAINGKWYYFNDDGLMVTGFQELNGKTYYLDTKTGQMADSWVQVYDNGIIDYYYFGNNGAMCTGWKEIDKKWYYFRDGKALLDTWAKINNIWYHFNLQAAMDTGWVLSAGKYYYMSPSDGSLVKGWVQDQQGNQYYLSEYDGSLAINTTINISGLSYTFDSMGKCVAKNQYIGDINGNSGTMYLNGQPVQGNVEAYGVNVGVSPAQNQIAGAMTGVQYQNQIDSRSSLEPGQTTGPK